MIRYRLVARHDQAIWGDNGEVKKKGETALIIAAETRKDALWFFSRIQFSAWDLVEIVEEAPPKAPKSSKGATP